MESLSCTRVQYKKEKLMMLENCKIKILEAGKKSDLFGRLMEDLFLALGYDQTRFSIYQSGRKIEFEAVHGTEPKRLIAECNAATAGETEINPFIEKIAAEKQKDPQLNAYFVSLAGFNKTVKARETGIVRLLDGKQVIDKLVRAQLVVSPEKAMRRAEQCAASSALKITSCDFLAHDSGWVWAVYFTNNKRKTHFALIHADAEPLAPGLAQAVIQSDRAAKGSLHALHYLPPCEKPPQTEAAKEKYFSYLAEQCGNITLEGLPADREVGARRLDLEHIFIPLFLQAANEPQSAIEARKAAPKERQPVAKILAEFSTRLAILAAPGGGKTTLIKRLAFAYAFPEKNRLFDDNLPARDWLPLLIRCRELEETLDETLKAIPEKAGMKDDAFEWLFMDAFREGKALLLVDGLDEIATEKSRRAFVRQLRILLARYPKANMVLTSRTAGFRVAAGALENHCRQYEVADLDNNDITRLTLAWHREVVGNRQDVLLDAEKLAKTICESERVRLLAKNPLLLTTLLLVKRWVGQLPTRRSVLYEKAIEVLLMTWNVEGHEPIDQGEAIPQLAFVAFAMMKEGIQKIPANRLEFFLEMARKQMPEELGYAKLSILEFIERIELRSSLLIRAGHVREQGTVYDVYEFQHLTFQEYLTALAIVNGYYPDRKDGDTLLKILRPHLADEFWKEVVPLAAVLGGREAQSLIEHLVKCCKDLKEPVGKFSGAYPFVLLSQCLIDEVRIAPRLLREGLEWIARHQWPEQDFYTLRLYRGKYGSEFLKVIEDVYMNSNTDLFGTGNKLSTITLYRLNVTTELTQRHVESLIKSLESDETIQKASAALAALAVMGISSYLDFQEFAPEEFQLIKTLGDKIIPVLYLNEPCLHFAACQAIWWLVGERVWSPQHELSVILRLLTLWKDSPLPDVQYMAALAIEIFPLLDRTLNPLPEPRSDLISFIKNQCLFELKEGKIKREVNRAAAVMIAFYWKILTDEELASLITSDFDDFGMVEFDYKSFLNALGEPGKAQLEILEQETKTSEPRGQAEKPLPKISPSKPSTWTAPVIKLKELELTNIGSFEHLKITFDEKNSLLVGFNGTGKTTILRALALTLVGVREDDGNIAEELLRLGGCRGDRKNYTAKGKIHTLLELDGKPYAHEVSLRVDSQTGEIHLCQEKPFSVLFDGQYLKSLIIGFGQQRGFPADKKKKNPPVAIELPKTGDLLPLVNNRENGTLHSFVSWAANLDIEAKNGDESKGELLENIFKIFSEITGGEEVRFFKVTNVDPLELWIKTKESPEGIPIYMASLGYQSMMGWVGYFIERMYEANTKRDDFYEAPAIVMADEIDLFLHPRWQKNILKVLRKHFPNTQFIVSTHSPLVVDGAESGQVTQLYYEKNRIIVKRNSVDIWAWQYQDILERLFRTRQEFDQYEEKLLPEIKKLQKLEERTEEQERKLAQLTQTCHRLEESRAAVDEVAAVRRRLEKKEKELTTLIQKLGGGQ